jgi:photosystem II CP43 chlorophyll apoprotein
MTVSTERIFQTSSEGWLVGNVRLVQFSGQLLGAHLAHAGLIMFWAGATTIAEVTRLDLSLPLGEQNLSVLPHLAGLGWGIGAGGIVTDSYPYFVIGMLHLVASAVLAAGGLFHVFRAPANLKEATGQARRFHYDWTDPKQLGLILGHHLLFLSLGAFAFVLKATQWGGIYDATVDRVRIIDQPTLDPTIIFGYLFGQGTGSWNLLGLAAVNRLEDVVGGHLYIAILLALGGVWHILVPMSPWAKKLLRVEADAILSYSLGALAFMAFLSCVYIAANPVVFPDALYGSTRLVSANLQALLGAIALGGHVWHAYRARASEQARAYLSFANAPKAMQEAVQPVTVKVSELESEQVTQLHESTTQPEDNAES